MRYTLDFFCSDGKDNLKGDLEPSGAVIDDPSKSSFVRGLKKLISGDENLKDSIYIIRVNSEWKKLFNTFFGYWSKDLPIVNEVNNYISHIDEGKYLGISLNSRLGFLDQTKLLYSMREKEQNLPAGSLWTEYMRQNGELLKIYTPFGYPTSVRIRFGVADRNQRVCRYCGKDINGTSFKNDSHTISKCLGNVNYFTRDECDACNSRFGSTIEQEFLKCISVYRSLSSLHSGVKNHKTQTDTFSLGVDDCTKKRNLKVIDENKLEVLDSETYTTLRLDGGLINYHKVYRALVKFVIGMLPEEELKYFEETIKWVNGDKYFRNLPIVKQSIFKEPVQQPYINMYFRINDSNEYPYLLAEFNVNHLVFIYAIPGCQRDGFEIKTDIIDDFLKLCKINYKCRNLYMNQPQPVHMNFDVTLHKKHDV